MDTIPREPSTVEPKVQIPLLPFLWKATCSQVISYFVAGLFFSQLFQYEQFFQEGVLRDYLKPLSSAWVGAGPMLNLFRGILFGLVLWLLRAELLGSKKDWWKIWLIFLVFAILGTCGPSPGSIEGLIYSNLSLVQHLRGLPEVMAQTLLFSLLLLNWEKSKKRKVWNLLMALLFILVCLMSLAGVFLRP